jgi:tetratricopeptide (TPR) repeat protein
VILRACEADTKLRYASAQEMLDDLTLIEGGLPVGSQRARQRRVAFVKKTGIALGVASGLAAVALLLAQQFSSGSSPGEGPPSTNEDANILCDDGLRTLRADNYADFGKAGSNLLQAIKLDANFARPYVGLLELVREWVAAVQGAGSTDFTNVAQRLEVLGPHLAATYTAKAFTSYERLDYPQAAKWIRKAVKTDPNYELAHTSCGYMLMVWGWPKEAREQLEISRSLAPSKATITCFIGHTYREEHKYEQAIECYKKVLGHRQQHATACGGLKETYEAMKDYPHAIDNAEKMEIFHGNSGPQTAQVFADLRRAFREGGETGYYQRQWHRANNSPKEDYYWKACIQMHLGNRSAALGWLEKAVQQALADPRSYPENLTGILFHECWDGVRDDPRFRQSLVKMSFTEVMPRDQPAWQAAFIVNRNTRGKTNGQSSPGGHPK